MNEMKVFAVVEIVEEAFGDVFTIMAVFTDYDSALEFAKNKFHRPEQAIWETTLNPEMT
jgi:hypothetical protein